jgi:hypothetical protein
MRSDPSLLASDQIVDATIASISDDRLGRLSGDIFVSFQQAHESSRFVDCTGGGLYGRDNLVSVINHPMALITQPAL